MSISRSTARKFGKGAAVVALAGALGVVGAGTAFAATASDIEGTSSTAITIGANGDAGTTQYLTTMGARAGSAGPDFLGVTNMNYDFQKSHSSNTADDYAYSKWSVDLATPDQFNRLAIWCSGVNTNANPYYQNLMSHYLLGETTEGAQEATTYHVNANSWGDVTLYGGKTSVVSATYAPDIIFGANKYTNWMEGDYATGTLAASAAEGIEDYNPTYANNDSTNIWTQMYSIEQLARTAENLSTTSGKSLRYDATDAAVAYEKAIKGQMLYCASQLTDDNKKTVAYLYAIDGDYAYFFVPTAEGLASGNDTGDGTISTVSERTALTEYAANNSTINMGYMATLPFITDTFGTRNYDIQMIVEDITKLNPAYKVALSDLSTDALADVDVIIYSTNNQTDSLGDGSSNGMNQSGVNNTKLGVFTDTNVSDWAAQYGFAGDVLAGDDFGTSTKQSAAASDNGGSPLLYCARNYTVDKNSRAAWAFSQVYPEFYNGKNDSSYAYWLTNVYHISATSLDSTIAAYTHQLATNVSYEDSDTVDSYAEAGLEWYQSLDADSAYNDYAYYNGSSRASYYSGDEAAETPTDTIGIFQPSQLWLDEESNAPDYTKYAYVTDANGKKFAITNDLVDELGVEMTLTGKFAWAAKYALLSDIFTNLGVEVPETFCHIDLYVSDGGGEAYSKWHPTQAQYDADEIYLYNMTTSTGEIDGIRTATGNGVGYEWCKYLQNIKFVTEHTYVDGICEYCGAEDPTYVALDVEAPAAEIGGTFNITATGAEGTYRLYYSTDEGTTWKQAAKNTTGEFTAKATQTNAARQWKVTLETADGMTGEKEFTLSIALPTVSTTTTAAAKYGAKATINVSVEGYGIYGPAKYKYYYYDAMTATWKQVAYHNRQYTATDSCDITGNGTNAARQWKVVVTFKDGRTAEAPFTVTYNK